MSRLIHEVLLVLAALVMILLTMLVLASVAKAEVSPQCNARDIAVKILNGKYGEARRGIGMAVNNVVMEIWVGAKTGTWTITATMSNGVTCLVASGHGFEDVTEPLPPAGDDL